MIRKALGHVAAVVSVVGMTIVAPMAAAGAAPVVHPASPRNGGICAWLDDGSGNGSASSLPPHATPAPGLGFEQVNIGAWQLCWVPPSSQLTLAAYPGTWCMADDSGVAELRPCNTHADQQWSGPNIEYNKSFEVQNANGGYLCAEGGTGAADHVVATESDCSAYHSSWAWEASP